MAEPVEDLLKAANDASGQARTIWISFILFGAYLAVTVGATTNKQLLLEAPIDLPLLGVKLPLKAFFQLVPGLFVLVHFYTLVQLYLLSRTLHLLNQLIEAVPSPADQERLRASIDGFVVTQLITGVCRDWLPQVFVRLSAWITLLAAPVALLLAFQTQFLAYHSEATTWIHRIALTVDLGVIWVLWPAIVHKSGRFGGALVGWIGGLVTGVRPAVSGAIALGRQIKQQGWRASLKVWREYLRTVEDLRSKGAYVARQVGQAAALLVICTGLLVFSFLIATIPGEAIEAALTQRMSVLSLQELRENCPEASPGCLRQSRLWWTKVPSVTFGGEYRAWTPTYIVFDAVTLLSRHARLARNIRLNDPNLIADYIEKLDKVDRTLILRERDLRGADLTGIDLRKADLTGARLEAANFFRANLQGATLAGAMLENAWLAFARLQGADLKGAQFTEANLAFADLQGSDLSRANLKDAKFDYTNLRGARLASVNFDGVDLRDRKADIRNITFCQLIANTVNCILGGDFRGADLSDQDLSGANLEYAHFEGANLSGANFQGVDLQGANLEGANLSHAKLRGADLTFASLTGADLSGAGLQGASLDLASLPGADLKEAELQGADLDGADLRGADFAGANLSAANIDGAQVWRAAGEGVNFDLVSDYSIELTADINQLPSEIAGWLKSIPAGDNRQNAENRLRRLTRGMTADAERALAKPWIAVRDRRWKPARDDPKLANALGRIGCDGKAAPYVARGLLRRIENTGRWQPYLPRLVGYLLSSDCEGAKGLSPDERSRLQGLAKRSRAQP